MSCLTLIWIGSAMRLEDALDQHGQLLIDTADDIAAEIALSEEAKGISAAGPGV